MFRFIIGFLFVSFNCCAQININENSLYFNYEIEEDAETLRETFFTYEVHLNILHLYFKQPNKGLVGHFISTVEPKKLSDGGIEIECQEIYIKEKYLIRISHALNYITLQNRETLELKQFFYRDISEKTYLHKI